LSRNATHTGIACSHAVVSIRAKVVNLDHALRMPPYASIASRAVSELPFFTSAI
jgi:hypothetical protein